MYRLQASLALHELATHPVCSHPTALILKHASLQAVDCAAALAPAHKVMGGRPPNRLKGPTRADPRVLPTDFAATSPAMRRRDCPLPCVAPGPPCAQDARSSGLMLVRPSRRRVRPRTRRILCARCGAGRGGGEMANAAARAMVRRGRGRGGTRARARPRPAPRLRDGGAPPAAPAHRQGAHVPEQSPSGARARHRVA